jgi:hypothetical protein
MVSGDRVTFVKPDTHSARTFNWSVDRGDLTLKFLDIAPPNATLAAIMIAIFESHPWKRTYQNQPPTLP